MKKKRIIIIGVISIILIIIVVLMFLFFRKKYSDCTIEDFNINYLNENNKINEYYQFGKKVEDRLNIVIPDKFMIKGTNDPKMINNDCLEKAPDILTEFFIIIIMSTTNNP